ncbi:DUF7218 family protein [Primorskyibacter sp. S187A]|uniref:DUF7218 family protein n=1 Tax=Primorskyibacter sp. S187A TaxID=3415130 RepID=UPI003C7E6A6E
MPKENRPTIKNDAAYEAMRREGYGKAKAASIANAQANDATDPSRKGGKAPPYEEWTKDQLYERARELDIDGRSELSKSELIEALRSK